MPTRKKIAVRLLTEFDQKKMALYIRFQTPIKTNPPDIP